MEMDSGLHRLIYEYYEARILSGFYNFGDRLPSIPEIGLQFNMSVSTVRSALALLEKDAYIQVEAKKRAKVILEIQPFELRKYAADYFVCREEGILDFIQARKLLFDPLLERGLGNWSEEDWETLRRSLADPAPNAVAIPVEFDYLCLNALDNGLLLNLYSETIRYIRFPYLLNPREEKFEGEPIAGESKEKIAAVLKRRFTLIYRTATEELQKFIRTARGEYALETIKPLPFEWSIYRKRPQMRYTLVSFMIRQMMYGEYSIGSFLPSLPRMADRYGVSLSTMRRTIAILNGLGITKSFHGKGIQVCMEAVKIDFSNPDIQEGMRLYREALQLLTWTIRPMAHSALCAASPKSYKSLAQTLNLLRKRQACYGCFEIFLAFIQEQCPLAIGRECYKKLKELLAWGYPFVLIFLKRGGLNAEFEDFVMRMEQALVQKDLEGFSDLWLALMKREQQRFKKLMSIENPKNETTGLPPA